MQFKYNRKNSRRKTGVLMVTAIWFLVISGGVVYAVTGSYNNTPNTGGIPPSAAQFANFANAIVNLLSANNGGGALNTGADMQNATDVGQGQALQTWVANGYMNINRSTGNQHYQSAAAGQMQANLIKANEASQVLYARADDLVNAMTLSIINEYSKSEEENIAELMEEGRKYGYITYAPENMADNASFSLISKAYADVQKDDPIYANGDDGAGQPSDCSGLSSNYGVTAPGGASQSIAKDQCAGRLFGAKLEYVVGLPGKPRCSASAQCDMELAKWAKIRATKGPRLHARIKKLINNATLNGGAGGGPTATRANTTSGRIETLTATMRSAAINACTAHNVVNQLKPECANGGGTASPRQNMYASALGAATSIDWHAGVAAAGTVHQEQHLPMIHEAAKNAGEMWNGGNFSLPSVDTSSSQ